MTLKKYIIFTIGSLILVSSSIIIYTASKTFKNSELTFALQTLVNNNNIKSKNIDDHLTFLKHYAQTIAYNISKNYKEPVMSISSPYIVLDNQNKIIKNSNFNKLTNCPLLNLKSITSNYKYYFKLLNNNACIYIPFTLEKTNYLSIFYSNLEFLKQKNSSFHINETLILPKAVSFNINNNINLNKILLRMDSSFNEDSDYYYQKQKVTDTNTTIISFIRKNKLGHQFNKFYYYSFSNLLIILFISIFVFYFIINSITEPINKLVVSSKKIYLGNYNINLNKTKYKEINELIFGFEQMVNKVKLREENLNIEVENKTKELIRSSKMAAIGTLAGGIAHEFNNIIGAIIGHASMAIESANKKEMKEALEIAISASERACLIVNRLLDFSKLKEIKKTVFKFSESIKTIINLLSKDFENNNISINFNSNNDDFIEAEQSQIEQVILNLAINSKHSFKNINGGLINIWFEKDIDHIYLFFKDNGSGIDETYKDKIFEPFFTTKGVHGLGKDFGTKDSEGTGLGLSVSQSIIENHNGNLEIYESTNEGTTFKMSLPIYKKETLNA